MNKLDPILLLMAGLLVIALAILWVVGILVAVRLARRQRRSVRRWVLAAILAGPILLGAGYLARSLGRSAARWVTAQAVNLIAVAVLARAVLPRVCGHWPVLDLALLLGWTLLGLAALGVLAALGPAGATGRAPDAPETAIAARKLHKSYLLGQRGVHVLRGVSLSVRRGEFVAILGASGSGKSTLLHVLGLLDKADSGELLIDGADAARLSSAGRDRIRSRDIGFVFQFYHLLPELTVLENTMLPAMAASGILAWPGRRRAATRRAKEILRRLGLADRLDHTPGELSGGEQQRVAIARALMNEPKILLADEPTGNLDSHTGALILELLSRLNKEFRQTVVMVTHDASLAEAADRVLHLHDGRLK